MGAKKCLQKLRSNREDQGCELKLEIFWVSTLIASEDR